MYSPCAPDAPGAEKMAIYEVPPNTLLAPDITADDFFRILA
jgi:hypothetical protein